MKRNLISILLLLGATAVVDAAPTLPLPPPGGVLQPTVPSAGAVVTNGDIKARLLTGAGEIALTGRISAFLRIRDPKRFPNVLEVEGLNIAYFGVPQDAITGVKPRGRATGVLGFAADSEKTQ